MEKVNYDKKMEEIINNNKNLGVKPRILFHTCCAPCSSYCILRLLQYFNITILYYNPNIEPESEYLKRKNEQKRFIKELRLDNVDFLDCDYNHEAFKALSKGLEGELEGGPRCFKCYRERLSYTAIKAKELGYDYFGTSLTVSPYKNSQVLNKIGEELQSLYGVKFLYSDFKKQNGYKKSIELSHKYNLYRQDYCGCKYSKEERERKVSLSSN